MLRSVVDSGGGRVPPLDRARLLSLVAHELRSPVSVIGGYLRMLRRDEASPLTERQRQILDEAERSCGRLTALVNEMSELSALESGTDPAAGQTLDLLAAVQDAAAQAGRDEGPPIGVRCEERDIRVAGSAAPLRAALATFIRAVRRERPDAGTIQVDCRLTAGRAGRRAVLVVGSTAECDAAAAEPDAPTEPVDETRAGLGLALPIAVAVVARHGGSVHALQTGGARGRGPVVVSLPIA